jgi:hypothetical protein
MTERKDLPEAKTVSLAAAEPMESGGDAGDGIRQRRRRLLKAGAAAAPVVMTLLSRPALGTNITPGECKTPSGFISGNVSQHGNPQYCSGRTPGYWKNHQGEWPLPYFPTTVAGMGGHQATKFHDVFVGSFFGVQTLLDVIQNSSGGGTHDLGSHIAAALLNAAKGWTPVLSVAQVKNIWSEFNTKGYFEPSSGVKWYAADIVVYLKTTMPL